LAKVFPAVDFLLDERLVERVFPACLTLVDGLHFALAIKIPPFHNYLNKAQLVLVLYSKQ
jgi:hypothetical protein